LCAATDGRTDSRTTKNGSRVATALPDLSADCRAGKTAGCRVDLRIIRAGRQCDYAGCQHSRNGCYLHLVLPFQISHAWIRGRMMAPIYGLTRAFAEGFNA
jgi:hypothetical protein